MQHKFSFLVIQQFWKRVDLLKAVEVEVTIVITDYRAEFFLGSQHVVGYLRNSLCLMEPEGSLLHSQEPATYPYPEAE